MDHGRYHQGWENNSALEGYVPAYDSNFRDSGSYDDRRYIDERSSRENTYPRGGAFHRDASERDNYPPPPSSVGAWPQTRRRSYEEEYSLERGDYRRNEKLPTRYGGRDREDYGYDDYAHRPRVTSQSRENSREKDYDYGRQSYDSDYDRGARRDSNWRRRESRDRDREWDKRVPSREREESPYRRHGHSPSYSRSHSRGHDDRIRSRSPRGRSQSRSHREDSYDDGHYDRSDRRRDREDRHQRDQFVAPSATVVVKGLSQKTTEEDLYQILAEWGPLRHIRVIKERNSGVSRGFAFIDFLSVDAAQAMMDRIGSEGLLVDGRKFFFEYSLVNRLGEVMDLSGWIAHQDQGMVAIEISWWHPIGCALYAVVSTLQGEHPVSRCNEPRAEDAPPADMASSNSNPTGKRGESGPTHVLVVRGLDENADEEMIRYEFSKHSPIKDLRLVRDKFTHVSRGFAFVHFYSVEDATKALETTNGTTLEKNGQILRVAFAKSIIGPGSLVSGASQSSGLAAAAIEAATFAQQYDAVGWAPKEYNPEDNPSGGAQEQGGQSIGQTDPSAPQSGFVWDEASGYYYDASSGFYYDGNSGLYYDGNNGLWYSYDQQTQQYTPCADQNVKKVEKQSETSKAKVVISAPAATVTSQEKAASLPDAVQAAAAAAVAAEKKEKERMKEIKLASKSSILANKKKMNNVLTMWKQRSHEGQAPRVSLEDNNQLSTLVKFENEGITTKENIIASSGLESQDRAKNVITSSGGTLKGVIRSSGLGVVKSDTVYTEPSSLTITEASAATVTPFRTDVSALGSYVTPVAAGSGKRRFSEMPATSAGNKEQSQTGYRDRAAERRNLYSSSSFGEDLSNAGGGNSNRDPTFRRGVSDSMPFPPGVGGGRSSTVDASASQSYEVITADKAIDESNVGNRMLRNMGWHEGSGLGKDGSGMVEPVQAQAIETRAGLGSHQPKKVDPSLEVQAGDSYRAVIQKKAIARFREMS
ncbi:hypothetical protein CASFOL_020677 [Castilleja foliolosa]|uniref:RNA-binding protein n=1 Tax=Castilleja foliolosa TaxID=1961234 RepID=A0ABD3D5B6_9LAMI